MTSRDLANAPLRCGYVVGLLIFSGALFYVGVEIVDWAPKQAAAVFFLVSLIALIGLVLLTAVSPLPPLAIVLVFCNLFMTAGAAATYSAEKETSHHLWSDLVLWPIPMFLLLGVIAFVLFWLIPRRRRSLDRQSMLKGSISKRRGTKPVELDDVAMDAIDVRNGEAFKVDTEFHSVKNQIVLVIYTDGAIPNR